MAYLKKLGKYYYAKWHTSISGERQSVRGGSSFDGRSFQLERNREVHTFDGQAVEGEDGLVVLI